jgi:hypothetical protein
MRERERKREPADSSRCTYLSPQALKKNRERKDKENVKEKARSGPSLAVVHREGGREREREREKKRKERPYIIPKTKKQITFT